MAAPASASARPHQRETDEQRKERKEKERCPGRAAAAGVAAIARVLLRCEGGRRAARYIWGAGGARAATSIDGGGG